MDQAAGPPDRTRSAHPERARASADAGPWSLHPAVSGSRWDLRTALERVQRVTAEAVLRLRCGPAAGRPSATIWAVVRQLQHDRAARRHTGRSPRSTTVSRKTCSSTCRAASGCTAACPEITPRRNQRGPSQADEAHPAARRGCRPGAAPGPGRAGPSPAGPPCGVDHATLLGDAATAISLRTSPQMPSDLGAANACSWTWRCCPGPGWPRRSSRRRPRPAAPCPPRPARADRRGPPGSLLRRSPPRWSPTGRRAAGRAAGPPTRPRRRPPSSEPTPAMSLLSAGIPSTPSSSRASWSRPSC